MSKKNNGYREIFIPPDYKNRKTHIAAALNGVWYQVKRGERVSVPCGVAEIIENAIEQEEKAYKMRASRQVM